TYGDKFRTASKPERKQMLRSAFAALIGSRRQYAELERKQRDQRRKQGNKVKAQVKHLTRSIHEDHDKKLQEQRKRQQQERRQLYDRQREEKARQVKDRRSGKDRALFERERDERRTREFEEQKREITKPPARSNDNSLRSKFRLAKGRAAGP